MAGASPIQQKIAGVLGLLVLSLACLYRWGDAIGFERAQVASQSPAVATSTMSAAPGGRTSTETASTEVAPLIPEPVVGPVRPDAIEGADDVPRAAATAALSMAIAAEMVPLLAMDPAALRKARRAKFVEMGRHL